MAVRERTSRAGRCPTLIGITALATIALNLTSGAPIYSELI